ncbi:hypothetical protein AMAG_01570 [Allomyces macrogynus ATCC 38327]|uniref:Uncharacterized protein n=1 Tax=Allomyces macrogynus (strain ATCC 38327) TaxID=578462 RepID=A0A0L0S031_ALLM3|nr:hypothetical protein AMAG_01570 [Allomyces macrogynus ATCC 38327]|eukprot:KNE55684.1 hypothetical protein AMAG_01570 [Allomyces macrogynus ATCC 38327]
MARKPKNRNKKSVAAAAATPAAAPAPPAATDTPLGSPAPSLPVEDNDADMDNFMEFDAKPRSAYADEDDFGFDADGDVTLDGVAAADLEVSDEDMDLAPTSGAAAGGVLAAALDDEVAAEQSDDGEEQEGSKKRKRTQNAKDKSKEKKRRKFAESLDRATLKARSPFAQAEHLAKHLLDYTINDRKMTTIEVQDKLLPESRFLDLSDFGEVSDARYPELVRRAVPTLDDYFVQPGERRPKASKMNLRKRGPLLLIICSSGIRCMDVIRALRPLTDGGDDHHDSSSFRGGRRGGRGGFRGSRGGRGGRGGIFGGRDDRAFDERAPKSSNTHVKIAKLFAKHMKVDEQVEFLANHPAHLAVGTPNRIAKLLDLGALKTRNLHAVVLDATFRDAKQRTLFTANESRAEFFQLYLDHLAKVCHERCAEDEVKDEDKMDVDAAMPAVVERNDEDNEDNEEKEDAVKEEATEDADSESFDDESDADEAGDEGKGAGSEQPSRRKGKGGEKRRGKKKPALRIPDPPAAPELPAPPMCIF